MPELAPYVSADESWTVRRSLYTELLAKPDTVLLLARAGDELAGYALAHVMPAEATWLADTWVTGTRIGEVESLAVAPAYRNRGIGSALLEQLERVLAQHQIHDLVVGVLPGNTGANRLYQSRGYRPTWLYLSRRSEAR
jgi:ribosomal protein S18 acetylase RimI-like enzyme